MINFLLPIQNLKIEKMFVEFIICFYFGGTRPLNRFAAFDGYLTSCKIFISIFILDRIIVVLFLSLPSRGKKPNMNQLIHPVFPTTFTSTNMP